MNVWQVYLVYLWLVGAVVAVPTVWRYLSDGAHATLDECRRRWLR